MVPSSRDREIDVQASYQDCRNPSMTSASHHIIPHLLTTDTPRHLPLPEDAPPAEPTFTKQPLPVKYDYVMMDTGYTSRLVVHYLMRGCEFDLQVAPSPVLGRDRPDERKDLVLTAATLETGVPEGYNAAYTEDDEGEIDHDTDETEHIPVLIHDALWGDGKYLRRGGADRKQVELMAAMLPADHGCVVYKFTDFAKALDIAFTLRYINYCACLNIPHDMHELVGGGLRILVLKFDCESG